MSRPVVEVAGLSKRYVIEHESRHDNLRDTLHHTARKLWRRFRWGTGFAKEEFWALRDVSFSVQPGEVVGIIGRNGAGKSTLLKILSRITEATSGKVTLRGRVASLLEVGTGFHPDLTGRENIFLNGAILGMSRAEIRRKFDEIVAFAEIERFLDTPVKRYSSGMYVRLAFAVAAHLEPEILIIDEVLAVGDTSFQKKCLGKMQDVARGGGRTVLFVSHNEAAVGALCTRAILMDQGRIAAAGKVTEIFHTYHQATVSLGAKARVTTPWLLWEGLQNHAALGALKGGEDVTLRLRLRVGPRALDHVELDCALANESGCVVTHTRSRFLGRNISLQADQTVVATFNLCRPNLAPGHYTLTVYARGDTGELLWVEEIPACCVLPVSTLFPHLPFIEQVTGATVPAFSLDLEPCP